ncbi:MAG TPA: pyrimidine dimer DNA glycosylase/endonuclease V [Candidatus Absconditabacterales bacterium]|nr:pyrimidine dimer DNA glycosylase/endonuclease V [Candidatus Absconditabacterales bacterium]
MTRINAFIPVEDLSNKHLIAEHREIKRIPNHVAKHFKKLSLTKIPKQFTLNTGHVTFFFDKGEFTYKRYEQLYEECKRRGFNVTYFGHAWDIYSDISTNWYKDIKATPQEKIRIQTLIRDRIRSNEQKALEKKLAKKLVA